MANKRKRRRKNSFLEWFKRLSTWKKVGLISVVVILLLISLLVIYVASKFSKLNIEEFEKGDIIINEELGEEVGKGYTNFVLFGGDSRSGDVETDLQTDAIIIVSLNNATKEVKLVSVYRDTLLDLTDGSIQKCNGAYRRGGAKQAINMLNMNLDLDIQKYVTVNFGAVAEVIDLLGGVEVDVTEAEMYAINRYIGETARVAGKKATYLDHAGYQTLNGVQATTYARIRKGVGDDFARTQRQRRIIQLTAEKAMKTDLAILNSIIDKVFPQVSTNLSLGEILKYAKNVTKYKIMDNTGFPFNKGAGTIPGKGSSVFSWDFAGDVSQLHEFLYGTIDYQPTSKVQDISYRLTMIVGQRDQSNYGDADEPSEDDPTMPEEPTSPEEPVVPEEPGEDEPVTPEEPTTPEKPSTPPEEPTTPPEEPTTPPEEPTTPPEEPTTPPEGTETTETQ